MSCGWVWLLCVAIVASFVGCTAAVQPVPAAGGDLTGVWIGNLTLGCVSRSARCLTRQDIRFTFVQHETSLIGFYQCSLKDHPCVTHQHGGRVTHVESTPHALLIAVRMDDGASCIFGAVAQKHDEMTGGCICDEVWGKPEKGWWRVQRAY